MPPHVSLITLGVADVGKATAFYERLGFKKSSASQDAVTFIQAGAIVLALWGRDAQREDAKAEELWTGNGGIVVAMNCASEHEVNAMLINAQAAGATLLKPAEMVFWGGYNGYFADLDGHVWEVAYNPLWPLREDGRIDLPE
ncbi:glyoxalase [Methyloceanibacter methanicus]|uniref:Glyoxalase n=1 Tax=Methyloceanibacter methanicus TaxID=1774968 RepID=A0A1E3W4H7_9HYPH|nr:VOC family protein [Methyloceanibacter methanicus]ODS00725.1 glyoxalase [Methyloceanibacter methanicus]